MIDPAKRISRKELIAEMEEYNDFFDMMVDMFPSQVYITTGNAEEVGKKQKKKSADLPTINPKYHKKGSDPASQKMDRKAAAKQKKQASKKPPAASEQQQEASASTPPVTTPQKQAASDEKKHKAESPKKNNHQEKNKPLTVTTPPPTAENKSRIESLRAKLQAKIAQKQTHRPDHNPDQVSKRAACRAEKRKRQEESNNRRANKKASTVATTSLPKYQLAASTATPAQDLAQVDFGRLTGLKQSDSSTRTKEILQNLTKPKNLHKMLADAEAKQAKLEELKRQQDDSAKEKLATLQWKDTFKEADGTRVKDDPSKLKKVLKRKAAKKAKSAKAWQSRTEQVTSTTKERQKIRQHNLSVRKQGGSVAANLSRKEIRSTDNKDDDRRQSRAGFEGRKREFLNKEKPSKPAAASSKQQ